MIYDCVIIGTGPAGLSAALTLQNHNKNFIWIGNPELSPKIRKAELITNYPGLPSISGENMALTFLQQIQQAELNISDCIVTSIMEFDGHYALMAGSEFFETKTVILATGVAQVDTIKNEDKFLGRGVSYCATCDGNLYREKTIALVSNSSHFDGEIRYLAGLVKELYLFRQYKSMSEFPENVHVMKDLIKEIQGTNRVESILTLKGETIAVDGVFCLRDSIALNTLLPGMQTENGHIAVDRNMSTNMKGVYAAGDCTGRPYQYAKAVGEGNVAALSAVSYIDENLF